MPEDLSVHSPLSDGTNRNNDHRPPLDLDNLKRQMAALLKFCAKINDKKD